jgi:exodeoxyribonuclease V gamma subunit
VAEDEDDPLEPRQRFFPTPLPPPEAAWRVVSLPQLLRFFSNPCRYLLAARLGVKLAAEATELLDDEPFTLEWAGRCSFSERLLPLLLQGGDRTQSERLAAAGHEFPDGRPGALLRQRELARLHDFALVVRAASPELSPEPLPFAFDFVIEGEAWQLSGSLSGLGPQGLLRYRGDDTRVADYLAAWLSHLALCGLAPPDVLARSRGLALNGEFSLRAVANARAILQDLLTCYRAGLRQPLHFFPKSAWAFMTNQGNWSKAYSRWQCTAQTPHGEAADPYYQLALRGEADPLAGDFADFAHRIYGPLLEHLEDDRLKG